MQYYSIMGLNLDHVDEICENIREQYETGVATCPLFKMTLVPEGSPPVDKAGDMAKKYVVFRDKLKAMGIPSGILMQASIGHGWKLGAMFPYQRYTNLNDGAEESTCCPYDDGFCDYIREAMRTLASTGPDLIMVDDDFRLTFREGRGCACPTHMARFNELAGTNLTREALYDALKKRDPKSREYTDIFVQTQGEALLKAARAMREGIDSVDPSIPGAFCGCGANMEFVSEIAQILSGKGNPIIVRINNGNYLTSTGRGFSQVFFRAAVQIANLGILPDVILDEPDTCPQNRYSTNAQVMHLHHVGTILEGVQGAKHWITRLSAYEPDSGKAFRKILARYKGQYQALADLVPSLQWHGCRIPLSGKPYYDLADAMFDCDIEGWSMCALERLGLPMYFSAKDGGAVFLEGDGDKKFTDEQIRQFFTGTVFLAGDTAKRLVDRGFGEYLGVDVRPWNGVPLTNDMIYVNGNSCSVAKGAMELVVKDNAVQVASMICNKVGPICTELFPGTTVYQNPLGGTTVVFSGTPHYTRMNLSDPFAFLNESRKLQLIELLDKAGVLPVYYPDDAEVYLRAADLPDGGLFCSVINLGVDPLYDIPLVVKRPVQSVEMMRENGERIPCAFHMEGDRVVIDETVHSLHAAFLFLH